MKNLNNYKNNYKFLIVILLICGLFIPSSSFASPIDVTDLLDESSSLTDLTEDNNSNNNNDINKDKKFLVEGKMLKSEIKELRKRIEISENDTKKLTNKINESKKNKAKLEKEIKIKQKEYDKLLKNYNKITDEYISFSQNVSGSLDISKSNQTELLEYLTKSNNPNDAVLVYQMATSILTEQTEKIKKLRELSLQQHSNLENIRTKQNLVNKNLKEFKKNEDRKFNLTKQRKSALKSLKEKHDRYLELRELYRITGIDSDLENVNMNLRQEVVSLARTELAWKVKEEPDGSNDSPDISRYRTSVSTNPGPGPWCVYFLSYIFNKAGSPIGPNGDGLGAVKALKNWGESNNKYTEDLNKAMPGDMIIFANHAGLVEKVEGKDKALKITTIEGNTTGNAVARRIDRQETAVGVINID